MQVSPWAFTNITENVESCFSIKNSPREKQTNPSAVKIINKVE